MGGWSLTQSAEWLGYMWASCQTLRPEFVQNTYSWDSAKLARSLDFLQEQAHILAQNEGWLCSLCLT